MINSAEELGFRETQFQLGPYFQWCENVKETRGVDLSCI